MGRTVADETSDETSDGAPDKAIRGRTPDDEASSDEAAGDGGDEASETGLDEAGRRLKRRKRTGRRVVYALFYSFVILFTLGLAAQITIQVYSPGAPWSGDCRAGLRHLAGSLAEAQRSSEGTELGVEEALRRFREAIAPGWAVRTSVERICRQTGDPTLIEAFDALERLRYAEEIVVRRQANDLSPLRRQARGLVGAPASELAPASSGRR